MSEATDMRLTFKFCVCMTSLAAASSNSTTYRVSLCLVALCVRSNSYSKCRVSLSSNSHFISEGQQKGYRVVPALFTSWPTVLALNCMKRLVTTVWMLSTHCGLIRCKDALFFLVNYGEKLDSQQNMNERWDYIYWCFRYRFWTPTSQIW